MSEWTISTLKEHIEKILEEREVALQAALLQSQIAIEKADARLSDILTEFPQEYGRKDDFEQLRDLISGIRTDHVQRREFDQLKDNQSANRGARIALGAVSGIVVALIAVALGAMYANQISHEEVSAQILSEAPLASVWVKERPVVEARIKLLEQQILSLKLQFAAHEAADRIRFSKANK